MPIENRNLEPGTKLIATYKKETYHALVVASTEGKVLYQLSPYDGREFKSPSALGTAVTGKSCNGWAFWSVDTGEAEQSPSTEAEAQDSTSQEAPEVDSQESMDQQEVEEGSTEQSASTGFRRVPNQRGVPEGEVRLYCDACKESFTTPVEQQPETCPQGHRPSDFASGAEPQS